jgi:hypothetical protein
MAAAVVVDRREALLERQQTVVVLAARQTRLLQMERLIVAVAVAALAHLVEVQTAATSVPVSSS